MTIRVRTFFEVALSWSYGHWIRNMNSIIPFRDHALLRIMYDWIYDLDGTVARMVIYGITEAKMPCEGYDFMNWEWYGDEYTD